MPDRNPDSQTPTPTPPRRASTASRVASLAVGTIVGLFALALLTAGGIALWANGEKDRDGYLSTGSDPIATTTHALASENLDVDLDGAGRVLDADGYGNVRLRVTPHEDKGVFVGIARTGDVERYLQGTSYATVTDVHYEPFRTDMRASSGDARPASPAQQDIWAASAHGAGTQTLEWEVEDGQWSVVIMNEDASAGVDTGVSAGAEAPFLPEVGWIALGGGTLLLLIAGGFMVAGIRTPRGGAEAPTGLDPAVATAY
jgi:hypothetical protein